jgi:hypothetical protein
MGLCSLPAKTTGTAKQTQKTAAAKKPFLNTALPSMASVLNAWAKPEITELE